MPASSTRGGHPPGLVQPSMEKTLRGGDEEEIEQDDEALVGNNETHEIADRCISLSATNPVTASSSLTRDV